MLISTPAPIHGRQVEKNRSSACVSPRELSSRARAGGVVVVEGGRARGSLPVSSRGNPKFHRAPVECVPSHYGEYCLE